MDIGAGPGRGGAAPPAIRPPPGRPAGRPDPVSGSGQTGLVSCPAAGDAACSTGRFGAESGCPDVRSGLMERPSTASRASTHRPPVLAPDKKWPASRPDAGHGCRSVLAFSHVGRPVRLVASPPILRGSAIPLRQGRKARVPRADLPGHAPASVSRRIPTLKHHATWPAPVPGHEAPARSLPDFHLLPPS